MVGNPDFLTGRGPEHAPEFQELESPEGEMHLRFFVGAQQEFALPAIAIKEVTEPSPEQITPVPNVSPLLLGTLNVRGQVLWVVDFGQFLGESVSVTADRSDIPVIAIEDQETMLGLAVTKISKMDWRDSEDLEPPSDAPDSVRPFLKGEWAADPPGTAPLRLLDYGAILHSSRWGGSES
ncbi:MAG: chemotaxis protein CheW [Cyanobacteria bacterium P01_F01_bin.153]